MNKAKGGITLNGSTDSGIELGSRVGSLQENDQNASGTISAPPKAYKNPFEVQMKRANKT